MALNALNQNKSVVAGTPSWLRLKKKKTLIHSAWNLTPNNRPALPSCVRVKKRKKKRKKTPQKRLSVNKNLIYRNNTNLFLTTLW